MTRITATTAAPGTDAALTPVQRAALARLHAATTQLEGVFVGMMLKAMRATVPKDSVFGKPSAGDEMFTEMLDDQRAQAMAKSGAIGIARVLDAQLRASVLGDAGREAKTEVPPQ